MRRVLYDDGDRLHGSILPYNILDVDVLLLRLDVLCCNTHFLHNKILLSYKCIRLHFGEN
jgi:hypothetical protein